MRVEDFDYELPEELIAQTPLERRSDSRLMVVDPVAQTVTHTHFRDLIAHLVPGDVLVLNNSRVLPARLWAVKVDTGARIELLLSKAVGEDVWEVLARPAKRLKAGTELDILEPQAGPEDEWRPSGGRAVVTEVLEEGLRRVRFHAPEPLDAFFQRVGNVPLPPYIRQKLDDPDRYQTVYAKEAGSVAAPTAGLHFTEELLQQIRDMGVEVHFVTLHVGLGTFKPVKVQEVEKHEMHSESYYVPPAVAEAVRRAKREGRRVIAVGTTALRTLEAAGQDGEVRAGGGDTSIFIYPGYHFRVIDALITNFHLPKSTLLMLVAAIMGLDFTKRVYEIAVAQRYRFFSFGDAMFIVRGVWAGGAGGAGGRDDATGAV
ncbi:tRNA preQ1(34) S-adenosylmethionine ribosyltransferase-isomerase QueA [Alicyclobacillus sp.]|uniref:tRNA preQ1(34) S-adenosylmethionine ribosyltransferase-isomerase QueA n=1 Tax=Alicyclobacillus sp. TaxID=61169 RepID=UPI0025C66CCB|nr:tRNA preQ1(34) S-adenosylmethionine ribosyltransferase-isomerase QueA [Alicyclobacillus sp.]MCL6516509.1 tRNA preQ1(34) S-adenosylmethionine ribosyltransferase-isomerase QueA [Alicyclobacillus sp.]